MNVTSPTPAASSSTCPRCGARFQCVVVDTLAATTDAESASAPCACAALTLAPGTFERLAARYTSCLCLVCLQVESREQEQASPADPTRPEPRQQS